MKMKTNLTQVPTRFARPTRFQLKPANSRCARRARDSRLEALKSRLLATHLAGAEDRALAPAFRRAANEAASLAWVTPYPLLVLPVLLEEKVAAARHHARRQALVLNRTANFLATAA
jgi:hypothetical protein